MEARKNREGGGALAPNGCFLVFGGVVCGIFGGSKLTSGLAWPTDPLFLQKLGTGSSYHKFISTVLVTSLWVHTHVCTAAPQCAQVAIDGHGLCDSVEK